MQKYRDIDNDSGVDSFDIGQDSIIVKFTGTTRLYVYSYRTAGARHVEAMKRLALAGDGLNAYINAHVKDRYER